MLGCRIAVLRRISGLSQAELANRLHISPSTVGMYEQGRREPSVSMLIAISQEFGVTIDYLLTGRPHSAQDVSTLASMIDCCDRQLISRLTDIFTCTTISKAGTK